MEKENKEKMDEIVQDISTKESGEEPKEMDSAEEKAAQSKSKKPVIIAIIALAAGLVIGGIVGLLVTNGAFDKKVDEEKFCKQTTEQLEETSDDTAEDTNAKSAITNDEAGQLLLKALQARWKYADSFDDKYETDVVKMYQGAIDQELSVLSQCKGQEFEDESVETAMNDYISTLEKQKEVVEKDADDLGTLWYNLSVLSKQRQKSLMNAVDATGLEFKGEDAENYKEATDGSALPNIPEDAEIVDEAFTILPEETKVEHSYDDVLEVRIKVRNNCKFTYPGYGVEFRVKDKDGVVKESNGMAYIEQFSGETTAFTEDIGNRDIKEGDTIEIYGYSISLEEGYADEVILAKPVVIEVFR